MSSAPRWRLPGLYSVPARLTEHSTPKRLPGRYLVWVRYRCCINAARAVGSVRPGRPRNSSATPEDVISSVLVVYVVPQRSDPDIPLWYICVWRHSSPVRSTGGIGPWTNPFPALYGGSAAAPRMLQYASTCTPTTRRSTVSGISVCRRRSSVDAIEPAPAQHRQDWGPLVCIDSTSAATTAGHTECC